jgi:hypothetical protein
MKKKLLNNDKNEYFITTMKIWLITIHWNKLLNKIKMIFWLELLCHHIVIIYHLPVFNIIIVIIIIYILSNFCNPWCFAQITPLIDRIIIIYNIKRKYNIKDLYSGITYYTYTYCNRLLNNCVGYRPGAMKQKAWNTKRLAPKCPSCYGYYKKPKHIFIYVPIIRAWVSNS